MKIRAVFLAAGFATRLYPLTRNHAKPLLEVGGEAMLTRLLRQVRTCDAVSDGVVVTNARFHSDFVEWRDGLEGDWPLELIDDGADDNQTRLGAIRDLALALDACSDADLDGYLVLACDNLLDLELELGPMVDAFASSGRGQLLVREVPEPVPAGRYSEVVLEGRQVRSFREKPIDPRSNLSAIAVYLLPRQLPELVRRYLAEGGPGDAPGHFLAWLSDVEQLEGSRLAGRWFDIGSAEDLARARAHFAVGEP